MSLSVQNKFETLNLKFTVDILPEKKINMVISDTILFSSIVLEQNHNKKMFQRK